MEFIVMIITNTNWFFSLKLFFHFFPFFFPILVLLLFFAIFFAFFCQFYFILFFLDSDFFSSFELSIIRVSLHYTPPPPLSGLGTSKISLACADLSWRSCGYMHLPGNYQSAVRVPWFYGRNAFESAWIISVAIFSTSIALSLRSLYSPSTYRQNLFWNREI